MGDFKIVKLLDPISITLNGPRFTGIYNAGTTYAIGESVSYNGSSYVALQVTTGNLPTDTSYWQLIAQKGDPGGDSIEILARNITGVTIPIFSVVYITGAASFRPTIELAQADDYLSSDGVVGITSETITNNSDGLVTSIGKLPNVDTSSFTEGDVLYLSASVAGAVTTVKPTQPDHAIRLGIVTYSNVSGGTVQIDVDRGGHLEFQHDVLLTTPTEDDTLYYDATTLLWKNKKGNTFESVSKNIKSWDYVLNYTVGVLTSIVYTSGIYTITKTLNYTTGTLTSLVLSGDTPSGITLTKTLNYTTGVLTSVAYS
jgi:hypothetical protein